MWALAEKFKRDASKKNEKFIAMFFEIQIKILK